MKSSAGFDDLTMADSKKFLCKSEQIARIDLREGFFTKGEDLDRMSRRRSFPSRATAFHLNARRWSQQFHEPAVRLCLVRLA